MGGCGAQNDSWSDDNENEGEAFEYLEYIPTEIQKINYDVLTTQVSNVAMIVGAVYLGLWIARSAGLTDGPFAVPMSNIMRTSLLAAVVLPILIQQIKNLATDGFQRKVGRNVLVAAVLTYVLMFSSASFALGSPLVARPTWLPRLPTLNSMTSGGGARADQFVPLEESVGNMVGLGATMPSMAKYY
jgi:hypothetical protein